MKSERAPSFLLPLREKVDCRREATASRMRGCGLSMDLNPSSAFASRRHLLPQGEKESRKERSPRLAEREIDALLAKHRMLAVGQWRDAVKRQPRRTAPDCDVAMLQPKPVRFVAALQSAEQKNRRQAQRHRDDRRGQIKLVHVLMQGHAGTGLVT